MPSLARSQMSAGFTPTLDLRVYNPHNRHYISKRTAQTYLVMARADRANGWAKGRDPQANAAANNKHAAAMRFYLALKREGAAARRAAAA